MVVVMPMPSPGIEPEQAPDDIHHDQRNKRGEGGAGPPWQCRQDDGKEVEKQDQEHDCSDDCRDDSGENP